MIASLRISVDATYHKVIRFQKSAFLQKYRESVLPVKRGKKWQIYSPSASFRHTRRDLKKGKTGEETPRSVLMAWSLRSIAPSIPVVSVALRRRFSAFRISHYFFLIRTSGFPNLSNPYFTPHGEMQQIQSWFVRILFSPLILRSVTGSPRI